MFVFGDPEHAALLLLQDHARRLGPGLPDAPLDELTEKELRILLAYLYGVTSRGLRGGIGGDSLDVLISWYDEVFLALAEASEDFLRAFAKGKALPPQGRHYRDKYLRMAGVS